MPRTLFLRFNQNTFGPAGAAAGAAAVKVAMEKSARQRSAQRVATRRQAVARIHEGSPEVVQIDAEVEISNA